MYARDEIMYKSLSELLSDERMKTVECFRSVGSTNDCAVKSASEGAPEGSVIIAAQQQAGRGRMQRSFYSPEGRGLYLSMIMHPKAAPERIPELTAWAAVAAAGALAALGMPDAEIKWVNDIEIRGKKVCGILTELTPDMSAVVGIGINVYGRASDFPEELRGRVSTLEESGLKTDISSLASAVISGLDKVRRDFPEKSGEYLLAYRQRCSTVGRTVVMNGIESFAAAVDDNFGIVLRHADGSFETAASGELSIGGIR